MNRLRPEISLWVAVAQNREDHCASNETEGELPLSLKGHTILILKIYLQQQILDCHRLL